MTIDKRIEKIERQLVRIRWVSCGLIICIVLSLVVWFISKNLSGEKEIRATQFIIEDANGKTRGALGVDEKGPSLGLFDENGKCRILLRSYEEGSMLGLSDKNQNPGVILANLKGEPGLELYDENGKEIWSAP